MAKKKPRRRWPHGYLDEWACALLDADPNIPLAALAERIGCSKRSLEDPRICPKFIARRRVKVWARERWLASHEREVRLAARDEERRNAVWRWPDDEPNT